MKKYSVFMLRNGDTESIQELEINEYNLETKFYVWERTKADFFTNDKNIKDVLNAQVWAKNEKHAIKIVNEHRGMLIATNQWK